MRYAIIRSKIFRMVATCTREFATYERITT